MLILPPSTPKLPRRLISSPHLILIDTQSLQPHRSPRMNLIRTNPHLRPKPKPRTIRKPRARVPKHARAVHAAHEPFRKVGRGCKDDVRMMRAVRVDVRDCEIDCSGGRVGLGDCFDGEDEVEEFGVEVGVGGVLQLRGVVRSDGRG